MVKLLFLPPFWEVKIDTVGRYDYCRAGIRTGDLQLVQKSVVLFGYDSYNLALNRLISIKIQKTKSQWIVLVCGENQMKLFFFIES